MKGSVNSYLIHVQLSRTVGLGRKPHRTRVTVIRTNVVRQVKTVSCFLCQTAIGRCTGLADASGWPPASGAGSVSFPGSLEGLPWAEACVRGEGRCPSTVRGLMRSLPMRLESVFYSLSFPISEISRWQSVNSKVGVSRGLSVGGSGHLGGTFLK